MNRPGLPSLILFGASLCVLAVSWSTRPQRGTFIDRSFLKTLCEIPEDPEAREPVRLDIRKVAEEHEASLLYLWSIGDPEAARAVVRCTLAELYTPICCCQDGHHYAFLFRDGVPDEFWNHLSTLTPRSQANVILTVEQYGTFIASDTDCYDPLAEYLALHAATKDALAQLRIENPSEELATLESKEPVEPSADQ